MPSLPDISVVTPVFNLVEARRSETFMQAVRSVLAQRGCVVEHIIVDGASRDGTDALIAQAQAINPALRVISEPDEGLFDAMNKGAAAANGAAVIFLNSDDFYHDPQGLSRLVAALRVEGCDYACAPMLMLSKEGAAAKPNTPRLERALLAMPFSHPTLAVARARFTALGGFDLRFRIAADYHFILRMILGGAKGAVLDESFVTFREGGISGDLAKTHQEAARVKEDVLGALVSSGRADFTAAQLEKRLPLRVAFALMKRSLSIGSPPRRMAFHALWTTLRRLAFSLHLGKNRRFILLGMRIF